MVKHALTMAGTFHLQAFEHRPDNPQECEQLEAAAAPRHVDPREALLLQRVQVHL
jgi:hypothetical protein